MKVLVTGGAGYIGSQTCKLLVRTGHEPVIFDNLSTGHRWLGRYGTFVHGDINNSSALMETIVTHRPEAVIHFAASAYVGESMQNPRKYFRNNVVGTQNLLDVLAYAGVRKLVFSSSCATYGIPSEMPIRETTAQHPINPYGQTKLIGEQMMRASAAAGELDCIALRYFNASGADPEAEIGEFHEPETHAIPLVLQAIDAPDRHFSVFGTDYPTPDGSCVRDFLHVLDLATAHLKALEALTGESGFRAYNLGTGRGYSVIELTQAAQRVTGGKLSVQYADRRPGDPPSLVADPSKAKDELNWVAENSDLETILQHAWAWMHSNAYPRAQRH